MEIGRLSRPEQKQAAATKRIDELLNDYSEDDVSDLTEWYRGILIAMIHNCKNHNVTFVLENGKVNAYSKYWNLCDKSEDQPTDENWYMSLRMKDLTYCPFCGKRLK